MRPIRLRFFASSKSLESESAKSSSRFFWWYPIPPRLRSKEFNYGMNDFNSTKSSFKCSLRMFSLKLSDRSRFKVKSVMLLGQAEIRETIPCTKFPSINLFRSKVHPTLSRLIETDLRESEAEAINELRCSVIEENWPVCVGDSLISNSNSLADLMIEPKLPMNVSRFSGVLMLSEVCAVNENFFTVYNDFKRGERLSILSLPNSWRNAIAKSLIEGAIGSNC